MKHDKTSTGSMARTIGRTSGGPPMLTAITIAVALLSATAVQAQSVTMNPVTKYAASGQPLKLSFSYSTNPDCSSVGPPTIRLSAPAHGRATITRTTDFPNFPPTNVRSECNRRRVAGATVHYVSQRGFTGTDYVQEEIIYPNGLLRQQGFNIIVR
jgi:hypothetical protein